MPERAADSPHFNKAVAQMGEQRPLVATNAIFTTQGIKLIDRGTTMTAKLYERLMQHQSAEPWQNALDVEGPVRGRDLRAMAETLFTELPLFARMTPKPQDRLVLLDLLESLPLPKPIAFQLTVARDVHPEQFKYFVATALIAGWLGRRPQVLRSDLVMIMSAGLLHDLGMLHVDPVLLQPKQQISRNERRQLYSHPLVSALLLQEHKEYSRDMVRAVREHHEMLDGSGYPSGLSGAAISPWGSLLAMAQLVAAMIKPNRSHAELRLSVLLRTNRQRYQPELVTRILGLLNPPPEEDAIVEPFDEEVADPVVALTAIDNTLADWPASLAGDARVTQARRSALLHVAARCARMRRTLVETGTSPELLSQIDTSAITGLTAIELSLITREMAWQLRALQRQVRLNWVESAEESYPPPLQNWFNQGDAAVSQILSR
ncbi:HD-GYP domain-containing protein [Variovorax sp. HJSM1_2]|uniref:HD-GYP domain-containing protein n=1 Tax=Variovorax sp. HJSM1_2 TaxID=3366263 RepID=UPI003BE3A3F7